MNKLVVLSLSHGNLHDGFPAVTVQLWESSNTYSVKFTGSLPAAPELFELYRQWQLLYSALYQRLDLHPRIEINAADVTNVSEVEFSNLSQRLSNTINAWLNSESFRHVDQQLRTHLDSSAQIRVIIETNDSLVQRLPWHLWNLFEYYPYAEVALSALDYQRPNRTLITTPGNKVKILAILGNSKGIDLRKDRDLLEKLSPQAEIKFLVEPKREQLNDHLWEKGWDILFFAGHSSSQEKGIIDLDETTSLTIENLKYALSKAIARGLKLAIFNSCDGLGLARDLADLHIPQVIVMREPVPDVVAQEFLRYFLTGFSSGQSLYTAVREARERLQKLEAQYPGATWLPVIWQNPAEVATTWQEWCGKKRDRPSKFLTPVLLASIAITALVIGVRQLGILQSWELQAFDQLLRLRPTEAPDPRLLIVTVTEEDVQKQNIKEQRSLSDSALAQLLQKLQPHQPQVVGLDIYRDFPADTTTNLATYLQDERFIAVCEVGEDDYRGIGSPPEVARNRLSFSDLPVDADRVIRRQLFGMAQDPKSVCVTDTSFSLRVALSYLRAKGIQYKQTSEGNLQIGNVVFNRLVADTGGYQQLEALGYQVLLNYRSAEPVAQQVTLYEILSGSLDAELPNLVKNRIVLIGTTARSFKDYFLTPYSAAQWHQELPGVVIHAHMISQVISAVLDRRPLLWSLPAWGETLWIWGWSIVGGMIVWHWRSPLYIGLGVSIAFVSLSGICFIFLLYGGWIPLVPSVLVLVTTGGVVAYTISQRQQ